jgi:hypothetical protein
MPLTSMSLPQGKRFSILHEAIATLRAAGLEPKVRPAKGSHFLISWRDAVGVRRAICVSRDSGDWNQTKIFRANLRRVLRGGRA